MYTMSQEKIKYKRPVEEKTGGVYSCDKVQLVYRLRFGEGQELLDQMARQSWFEYDHWESRKFGTYRNQFSVKCGADGKLSYWLGVGMVAYGKSRRAIRPSWSLTRIRSGVNGHCCGCCASCGAVPSCARAAK